MYQWYTFWSLVYMNMENVFFFFFNSFCMKDSLTGCEDFIAHCCFENHGVEEKSDAKLIKNLLTFVSGSYKICSLSFTLIHFRSKYTSSVLFSLI